MKYFPALHVNFLIIFSCFSFSHVYHFFFSLLNEYLLQKKFRRTIPGSLLWTAFWFSHIRFPRYLFRTHLNLLKTSQYHVVKMRWGGGFMKGPSIGLQCCRKVLSSQATVSLIVVKTPNDERFYVPWAQMLKTSW